MVDAKVVTVFTEERFYRDSTQTIKSPSQYDDVFWGRYLEVFDRVNVVGRVCNDDSYLNSELRHVENDKVSVLGVPDYRGGSGYIRVWRKVKNAIVNACDSSDNIILRMPGQLGNVASNYLIRNKNKYGVELVGDPEDVFGNGGAGGLISPFYSHQFKTATQYACANAAAVSYVTETVLQRKYPAKDSKHSFSYSSIVLDKNKIKNESRVYQSMSEVRLITVGSLEQMTKGVDTVLRSLSLLRKEGVNAVLQVIGDGASRKSLEKLSEDLNLSEFVVFSGALDNSGVFEELDKSDVFVLATKGEGLPRVVIEAMARALPVVSTNVSGIPELITENFLVPPSDHVKLYELLKDILRSPVELSKASANNLRKSMKYESCSMQAQRRRFYEDLLDS